MTKRGLYFKQAQGIYLNKIIESLDLFIKAYNSKNMALPKLPKKLQEYPNPREEKINLAL